MKFATSFALIGLLILIVGAAPANAQGRVTGLKISNSNIVGTDLSFDVTLYTSSPADNSRTGFLGNHYHTATSSTDTDRTTYTYTNYDYSYYPCNTMTYTNYDICTTPTNGTVTYPCNTTSYTVYDTCTYTSTTYTYDYSTWYYTYLSTQGKTLYSPGLPAIDWGDGIVVDATTMPLVATSPTNTYRRSFSHSYASTGSYQVRVGAFELNPPSPPPYGGNVLTVNAPDTFAYHTYDYRRSLYSGSTTWSTYDSTTYTDYSPSNSPVGITTSVSFNVPVELQSFNIADARPQTLSPPSGPGMMELGGLGLGVLCAAFGFILLRRE
ncbi:MAG: hypothetical protein DRJ65_18445 [Acidobacteria bacterium]|nr:MAG: hypothetical protein DRJ65_18445 [Acidobacteriota bacterium]